VNLADMLAHVREYIDDYSDLIDGDPDQLWSDGSIVRHLNQGARILCRRAWAIIEYGVAPAGVIVLATGKVLYPLHPSVLRVFDATPSTQALPLGRDTDISLRDVSLLNRNPDNNFTAYELGEWAARAGVSSLSGVTDAFGTDAGTRTVRIFPPPAVAQNGVLMALRVARMPIVELTLDNVDAAPETPREWDMSICDYAMGKCLLRPNIDTQAKVDGRELVASFMEEVRQARQERVRAEMGGNRWAFNSTTATLGR
jgi:hypothetical protein